MRRLPLPATIALGLVLVGVAATGVRWLDSGPDTRGYCALMPDSIGLYPGSAVTVLGVGVGEVTRIEPAGDKARVDFRLPADRALPADGGAVTVSDTLIAERHLALVGDTPTGPGREPSECITRTVTPQSMSQTFAALAGLADQLNGATTDPAQRDVVRDGIRAADDALAGTGERFNAIVRELGAALDGPDAAIGHLGALIDSLAELAHSAATGWADIRSTLTRLAAALTAINEQITPPIIEILADLVHVLPPANDLTTMFAGPLLRRLDEMPALPQMLSAGVRSLSEIIAGLPVLTGAFGQAVDPVTGRMSMSYDAPDIAVAAELAQPLCAAIELAAQCSAPVDGTVRIPIQHLLFGSVGAR